MKNIIKYLLISVAAPAMLVGCIEEELPQNGYVIPEQTAGSSSAQEAAIRGLAAWLNESMSVYDEHWDFGYPTVCMAMDALTCDVAVAQYGYDAGALNWRVAGGMLSDTGNLPDFLWTYFYRLIFLANSTILSLDSPADGSDVETLSASARATIGQVLTYRAMCYLHLARVYEYKGPLSGDFVGLTVPWIDQYTTESQSRNNPRLPHAEMYEHIVTDLQNAVKYLDGFRRSSKTEIDQSVAYGYLARTYLQMEKWSDAESAAASAIAGGYRMLTESEWTDPSSGFNNMNVSSWMWAIHITSNDDVVQTGICNWASFMASEFSGGYCAAQSNYSAKLCDARLYNSIPDSDWRKKSWLDADRSKYNYQTLRNMNSAPNLTNIKFRPGSGNVSDYTIAAVTDFPIMRVEEMYLIQAEAKAMGGDVAGGKALLESFAKTRNSAYTCTASSAKELQDEIFHQRQIEFWGEGIVMFDYKRLDKPQFRGYTGTNHNAAFWYNSPNGNAPWTSLPVPYDETITNLILAQQQNPQPVSSRGALWTAE